MLIKNAFSFLLLVFYFQQFIPLSLRGMLQESIVYLFSERVINRKLVRGITQ